MLNPALLLCDSDALTQFFLANELRPLRQLKDLYGIQPAVVQEVDLELRWVGKHRDRFVPQLDKALKSNVLCVLEPPYFQSLLSTAPVGASWAAFQSLGAQYDGHIGPGEAYTFAAAVTLNLPALSNDFSAIKTLESNMLTLPTPVLRSFDLLAFCFQNGLLELKACEAARGELLKNGEGLPKHSCILHLKTGLRTSRHGFGMVLASVAIAGGTYSTPLQISRI